MRTRARSSFDSLEARDTGHDTPHDAASRLNTDPQRFASEGYCVFRSVVPAAEIAEASRRLGRLMAANPDIRPEHLCEPHKGDRGWLELCRHPRIVDAVRRVLGDDLILIMTHLIVKPPRDGLKVAWHQDKPTWASVKGYDIVTAWLAIDDADPGNGCMNVIPNSHEGHTDHAIVKDDGHNVFDFRIDVTPEVEAGQVPIVLRAGDMSLHDSYAIHGSEANTSDRRRAGYTIRFANASTTRIDVKNHFAPVFIVSGSGGPDAAEYIDLRPGVPAPESIPLL